ncbi:MAG: hypothetical protein DRP87_04495 [Spirochaetes bacterium]|nr:MAG: hypothetical protein DRP87_04495 [Spirochaetota bacterium]
MEQLAPHEKVFVDPSFIEEDKKHGNLGCTFCHGGDPNNPDYETAHSGVRKDPSYPDASGTCGICHTDSVKHYETSLHYTLEPYIRTIKMRSSRDNAKREKINTAMERHCLTCHSSCGQCHVSRPDPAHGGLLESHIFKKEPLMQEVCTSCHGSRVGPEFLGMNEGIPADIHRQKSYFKCTSCHSSVEMHGDGVEYANRYEVATAPECESCHRDVYTSQGENTTQHTIHKDKVSCQVCHAMPYKNCWECHVGTDDQGLTFFRTKATKMDFKIGLNPARDERHPEKFVTVRHIPVDFNTFSFYVEDGLSEFNMLPNWKMTTPHTIRRETPQNSSCDSCHGNESIFLSLEDVEEKYREANKEVIVPKELIPAKVGK